MKKYSKETWVGIFVLVGLACVAYMTVKLGNVQLFTDNYYTLKAKFTDVSGLKVNAPVQMFGVQMGFVEDIEINQEQDVAEVTLKIDKGVVLTDDAIVSVKTSGLIGDKFVKITPGGVGDQLKPGSTIFDTEPAIDLEDLISKYVFGKV
ncbi:MAG: outer membrane lipid asymmetry maintenance protein MlaD [Desulfovibrionaceae bacterium]|nr:outer membrane lipid asymmetry maintenance protein MlaD [Desulfovibrionaceae bacterium]MDD4951531.1 outer membrane lipid asymmetry maintenance protein MlaD [Desulfovibrionaceae bacterium]